MIFRLVVRLPVFLIAILLSNAQALVFGNSHELGIAAYLRGDYQEAAQDLTDAATHDDPAAYFYLGQMYRQGLGGLTVDSMNAYHLIKAAAQEGFAPACMSLADWYAHGGQGIHVNNDLAILWLEKAAKLHVREAQMRLADIYQKGLMGVLPDETLAQHWLKQAASEGDSIAQWRLDKLVGTTRLAQHPVEPQAGEMASLPVSP